MTPAVGGLPRLSFQPCERCRFPRKGERANRVCVNCSRFEQIGARKPAPCVGLLSFPDAARRSVLPLPILDGRIYRRKRFSGGQLRPTKEVVARRRPILLLALALTAALSAGASRALAGPASSLLAPAGACGPAADRLDLDPGTAQKTMRCLTNYARIHDGLRPLVANATLNGAGAAKLEADISCGEFTHTPCSKPFTVVCARYVTGANSYSLGENIAWGTGSFGTPRETM